MKKRSPFHDSEGSSVEERKRLIEDQHRIRQKSCFDKVFGQPWFIWIVSLTDVLLFAYCIYLNQGFESFSTNPMLGPKLEILLEMGAKDSNLILHENQWWRLVTPIFLHLGVIHLFVNLMFQLTSGADLERHLGHTTVIFVYFISGVGGNLASAFFLPTLLGVGASSSLFGMVATILVDTIKNWSNYDSPLRRLIVLIVMLAVNVALGLLPLIDNFAHIGGFVTGFFAACMIVPCIVALQTEIGSYMHRYFTAKNCFFFWIGFLGLVADLLTLFILFYDGVDPDKICPFCKWLNCPPVWTMCKTVFPEG